jgi:diketogulonate reductase-like aldo/keto reductase
LDLLGLPYSDLLLIHWTPVDGCSSTAGCTTIRTQWKALEALQAANKTRSIGVSNFCRQCLECIATDPAGAKVPVVNQIELHVGMGPDPEGLKSYCRANKIVPQAYSPLGPTFNATAKDVLIKGPLTTGIGKAHNKSGAQVALKYLVQDQVPLVTRALEEAYLEEDIGLFDFTLTDEEIATLNGATDPWHYPCLLCNSTEQLEM